MEVSFLLQLDIFNRDTPFTTEHQKPNGEECRVPLEGDKSHALGCGVRSAPVSLHRHMCEALTHELRQWYGGQARAGCTRTRREEIGPTRTRVELHGGVFRHGGSFSAGSVAAHTHLCHGSRPERGEKSTTCALGTWTCGGERRSGQVGAVPITNLYGDGVLPRRRTQLLKKSWQRRQRSVRWTKQQRMDHACDVG